MVVAAVRKLFSTPARATSRDVPHSSSTSHHLFNTQILSTANNNHFTTQSSKTSSRIPLVVLKAASKNENIVQADSEDGVSLGTMKLPGNIDIPRFESLLFQVDKISGGARLGFITIGNNGETEVLVYIDCLVFPSTDGSGPVFRAIRNGGAKDRSPPGEPRIMRSLLEALKKSVEIATV